MKKFILFTLVSFFVLSLLPANIAFAEESEHNFLIDLIEQVPQAPVIDLTAEAREIALSDFDFLANVILETAPAQAIANRRFGMPMADILNIFRDLIYNSAPMPSLTPFVIRENFEHNSDLYIAADYLLSILALIEINMGGLGHLMPRNGLFYNMQLFALSNSYYHGAESLFGDDEREAIVALGHDVNVVIDAAQRQAEFLVSQFAAPQSLWFYGADPSEFDFYDEDQAFGTFEDDNIETRIIADGQVAYVRVNSFINNHIHDSQFLLPFFEQIQDFENLIIDLRGNSGGIVAHFPYNFLANLNPVDRSFRYYEFFMSSEYSAPLFINPTSNLGGRFIEAIPAAEFVSQNELPYFNMDDLDILDYVIVREVIIPAADSTPFEGKIWLLIDNGSASASENAAIFSINSGFATVVGEPSSGVTGVIHMYKSLPQTGIIFRIDLGSYIDSYGRSMEEFGVIPQIPNAPGLDALETVLEIIGIDIPDNNDADDNELLELLELIGYRNINEVIFVPARLFFYATGADSVSWIQETSTIIATADGVEYFFSLLELGGFVEDGVSWVPLYRIMN